MTLEVGKNGLALYSQCLPRPSLTAVSSTKPPQLAVPSPLWSPLLGSASRSASNLVGGRLCYPRTGAQRHGFLMFALPSPAQRLCAAGVREHVC